MNLNFDSNLKGKRFKVFAGRELMGVFEANGQWSQQGDTKYIRLIRMYTIYGKPNPSSLPEYVLEETNEELTPLKNMPT